MGHWAGPCTTPEAGGIYLRPLGETNEEIAGILVEICTFSSTMGAVLKIKRKASVLPLFTKGNMNKAL